MDIALQGASRAEDLIPLDDPRSPYAWSRIFEPASWGSARRNKKRLELLRNLDADLDRILHDGERIVAVTTGREHSAIEQHFLGLWSLLLNGRALLLTNERLLILQVSGRGKLLDLKWQLSCGAIDSVKCGMTGVLQVKPKRGKKMLFNALLRRSGKALRAAIEAQRAGAPPASTSEREALCPRCYEVVEGRPESCPKCRSAFKSARKAALLSLAFPGVGDLYMGHRALGVFQVAGGLAVWGVIAAGLVMPEQSGDAGAADRVGLAIMAVVVHGLDALITGYTARKGLYPGA